MGDQRLLTLLLISSLQQPLTEACKKNEHKVQCYHHIGVPGRLCPGVSRWPCSGTKKRCACKDGFAQDSGGSCIHPQQCVSRSHDPAPLLKTQDDVLMVGITGGVIDEAKVKCIKSKFVTSLPGVGYPRVIQYDLYKNKTWKVKLIRVLLRVLRHGWNIGVWEENHKFTDLVPQNARGRLLYGMNLYPVLHANHYCIILGELPYHGGRANCTYWVRNTTINSRHWSCDYIFDEYCRAPRIVLNGSNLPSCAKILSD
uniref:Putative secreted protein n=1 Tax=Amblyomma triste TaxID=251400 RepID=A0A023G6V6_AMBTT